MDAFQKPLSEGVDMIVLFFIMFIEDHCRIMNYNLCYMMLCVNGV